MIQVKKKSIETLIESQIYINGNIKHKLQIYDIADDVEIIMVWSNFDQIEFKLIVRSSDSDEALESYNC